MGVLLLRAGAPAPREDRPKGAAREEHAELRKKVRRENYCPRMKTKKRPTLFEDAAREYQGWSEAHKRSAKTNGRWLARLKATFAGKTLEEITPESVERFKQALVEERTEATVNRHLACLRHLYNRAIRRGNFTGRNPVSAVGLFREDNGRGGNSPTRCHPRAVPRLLQGRALHRCQER